MPYVLAAAISLAAAAAIVGARSFADPPRERASDATPTVGPAEPEAPASPTGRDGPTAIEGRVMEIAQVPRYTYLRLGRGGMEGVWVAVPTTTIQIGGSAHVRDAMKMTDFTSTALKRTFPIIYFGTLDAAPEPASDRSGHATQPVAASAAQMPLGPVNVQHVDPASGASGRTVAELVARRAELSGTSVRVRGTVVKVTPGVLGRTYLHVRDGSGDAADATNDVAVTTDTTPTVGDLVIVEGVLAINRDIGSGYLFPVIIENAQVAKTP